MRKKNIKDNSNSNNNNKNNNDNNNHMNTNVYNIYCLPVPITTRN